MTAEPSALPQPQRERWQPLRLGLVDLYRYDSEEFWFRDGHLLLRGNNGTGKSKVLSLTLPLLLDASLRSSRVEPDGDPGKRMAWNLLMGDAYERRTGYSWIEFGRVDAQGHCHFLTLGMGLRAVAARGQQVESWSFITQGQAPNRIGQNLHLLTPGRQVLDRERLREALGIQGQVFDNAQAYRRAVDEQLFALGERRYDALIDTLIQLRQPQLSRRPDERALSAALTESLPPLAPELLADVADALTQLEDLRQALERIQRLHLAVQAFDQRYRSYAGMASRRQARGLRQAQTEYDNASSSRHAAQTVRQSAQAQEALAQQRLDSAQTMLAGARTRLETLLADPLNTEADRLQRAGEQAHQREQDLLKAQAELLLAQQQAQQEQQLLDTARQREARAHEALRQARQAALDLAQATGLQAPLLAHPHLTDDIHHLAEATASSQPGQSLDNLVEHRHQDLQLVRRRLASLDQALARCQPLQQTLEDRRADTEDASAALAGAEQEAEQQAQTHQDAWAEHLQRLQALQPDAPVTLHQLESWVLQAQGPHPGHQALRNAHSQAIALCAQQRAELAQQTHTLHTQAQALRDERQLLHNGKNTAPSAPPWRNSAARQAPRAGAPLWQLLDFAPEVPQTERDGLESALAASGLLDAWLSPQGQLQTNPQGQAWADSFVVKRPPMAGASLALLLRADPPAGCEVPALVVNQWLTSVACSAQDDGQHEAWFSPHGGFRLGSLAGQASPTPASHIGHAARQAARQQRLAQIETQLTAMAQALLALQAQSQALDAHQALIDHELHRAPSEHRLQQALGRTQTALQSLQQARQHEAQAHQRWLQAEQTRASALSALTRDAQDLRLPSNHSALDETALALQRCGQALHRVGEAVRNLPRARADLVVQQQRLSQAQGRLLACQALRAERALQAEQARTHLAALESVLGGQVQDLRLRLDRARALVARLVDVEKRQGQGLRLATEARAVAEQHHTQTEATLARCTEARTSAVEQLRLFAATGLLASGLTDAPETLALLATTTWSLEAALALARRTEQALAQLDDGPEPWKRAQQRVTEDLQGLQAALSALGEHATATTTDFGFVVHVQWQQRAERPEVLAAMLANDLQERQALLSAREREVLENHLQSEIASQIQALMRAAQRQVQAINTELQRRPTSTGVRFRLLWQPLAEGQAAPAGLHTARERLLNTHADLWTSTERRAFGALLLQRIQDERQQADAVGSNGGLLEQLTRALDYRQWHQFRVERWQDGHWRKLSGPASSGERALGLTVPLFAAVATFYQSSPLAPRLMLLDEAFAGIDDAARAHCMGLVREFDLDFVITSEREWACYAELPGVAICQLQRREGIDAVHVSRWTWDGQARRMAPAPPRTLPALTPQATTEPGLDLSDTNTPATP